MKHQKPMNAISRCAIAACLLLAGGSAGAAVVNTVHNLGTTAGSGTPTNTYSGTAEICVFCHTPHGADDSASVPLWNRNLPGSGTYTTYSTLNTSSMDSGETAVGSVSIACLSCHDGSQAMDVIINEPGSGFDTTAYTAGTWTTGTHTAETSPTPTP